MKMNSKFFLGIAILLVVIFFVNLAIGKYLVIMKLPTSLHLEGVTEFILLLIAVVFFAISALLKEKAKVSTLKQKPK